MRFPPDKLDDWNLARTRVEEKARFQEVGLTGPIRLYHLANRNRVQVAPVQL